MKRLANAGPTAMGLVGCAFISLILLAFTPWVRASYYTWQGDRMVQTGHVEAAQSDYMQALAVRRTPGTLVRLADTYIRQHRPVAAVALLREAVKLAPQDSTAHYKLGVGLLNTGDAASAKDQLTEAVRLDQSNGMAHLALTKLAQRHGDPLATARDLETSTSTGTPESASHLQLGEFYLSQGDERAESEFRSALSADPSMSPAHLRLGFLLLERDPKGATEQFHQALNSGQISTDDRARALAALSLLAYGAKDTLAANDYLSQASALRPSTGVQGTLSYGAGIMRWNSTDRLNAFRYFNNAQQEAPSEPAFHEAALVGRLALYGRILTDEREGRLADAENGLRHLVALLPDEPEYRIRLGCVMLARHETASAIGQFRSGLSAESGNPEGWLKLSAALFREGKNEESYAAMSRGMQIAPYWTQLRPDVDLLMGKIELACNRPQEALPYLNYAAATHSSHVNVTECNQLVQVANARVQGTSGPAIAQVTTTTTTVQPGAAQGQSDAPPVQVRAVSPTFQPSRVHRPRRLSYPPDGYVIEER